MKCGHKCSQKKLLMGIPALLAVALIIYISIIFLYHFLPITMPVNTTTRFLIEIPFYYFSLMTLVSIFVCAASDPGYLSLDY